MRTSAIPVGLAFAGAAAALMALAHAPFGRGELAWVALVPLLLALRGASVPRGALLGWFAGFVFFCLHTWWGFFVAGFNPANYVVSHLANGLGLCAFGAAAAFFQRRRPGWNLLTLPSLLVITEFGRVHAGFLAFPWGPLGYTQHGLPTAGLAAFLGVYGVSFAVALGNVALVEASALLRRLRSGEDSAWRLLRRPALAGALAVAPLASVGFAGVRLPERVGSLRVALVQPNTDWTDVERGADRGTVLQVFSSLTVSTRPLAPDLIVWPSAAIPGALPREVAIVRMLGGLARETGAFLFAGSTGQPKMSRATRGRSPANSAFLFAPDGALVGRYDKMRLLPFDEYLPLRGIVPWPEWIVPHGSVDFRAGDTRTVFDVKGSRVGVQICWENLFTRGPRAMAREGIDLLVSMTNERFTDTRAGHEQMLVMNAFRAIENGVWIVRTAPTGVSAVIDPSGRVVERVRSAAGEDLDVAGTVVVDVPLLRGGTPYTRHGDWLPAVLASMLGLLAFPGRRAPPGGASSVRAREAPSDEPG